ncbi:TolC family protein [Campylobacter sp. MIT 99-7217]|uniref:TolC family protein n=1 Tax=Campylobacter sp. MIT 99-7217 TaxID=535091 RepID=UPI0011575040|nr:TolC family protein [Campylobacter sp. MIT 99-7217]TQR34483.1 TolC family protein [Campylobacter sp. MIT 99-7217]
MKKILFYIVLSAFFIACSGKLKQINEPNLQTIKLQELNLSKEWWKSYENEDLNAFITYIEQNNADINIARINLLKAVANYKLINFDMYPSLSGNLGANVAKDLNLGTQSKSFSNSLNLSYELDIYGKISNQISSKEFSAKASEYDLENLRLSTINSSIDYIFDLAYFNDVENLLKEYILNLEQSYEIYKLKYELGKVEELEFLNMEQSLYQARQNLLSNQQNKELVIKNIKDLLGQQEGFLRLKNFESLSLTDFKDLNISFDLPLEIFAYRADVRSKANALFAAFEDTKAAKKAILPSVSLGGSLSGSDEKFNPSFKYLNLGGALQISLPFLDFARVRQNIKISEFSYEALRLEYEQALQVALNEFYLCYKDYEFNKKLLENIRLINAKQELITKAYAQKYELGKSELKDFLDAQNSFISSSQEILSSRLKVLKTTNLYYKITTIKP